jgi:hypothetical protein
VNKTSTKLYFLAGVTSSGKTQLALEWAEENGARFYLAIQLPYIREWISVRLNPLKADQKGLSIMA